MLSLGAVAAFAWLLSAEVPVRILHPGRPPDLLEDSLRTLRIGDMGTARLDIPSGYVRAGAGKWPLLVVLHSLADKRGVGAAARLLELRDESRFVLFPDGRPT